MDNLQLIKEQICDVCHKMWQLGWVAANDGNVSARLSDGRVIDAGYVTGADGVTFTPSINEQKILSWTNDGGLENPEPVDLNPFDEWSDIDGSVETQYIWSPM